jgi:hypothetical protein
MVTAKQRRARAQFARMAKKRAKQQRAKKIRRLQAELSRLKRRR